MLKISRSSRNRKMDKEKAGRIAVLAENQENLITAIEEEKAHMSDLEREIRRIEKQIASQRLKAASGRSLESYRDTCLFFFVFSLDKWGLTLFELCHKFKFKIIPFNPNILGQILPP